MTDNLPVFQSRQSANGVAPHPALTQQTQALSLSETERVCNMIASGGDMVPPAYRGKPGAVLLAKLWADKNGVDLLTAVQNVYPIQGKPYVAAEMRVELASLKGYEIEVVTSTSRRCELEVTTPKGKTRRVVAAMPDQPEEEGEGLIFVQPAPEDLRKQTWKERTSDMLYALACRIADRRLVRSGAALLDTAEDYNEPDPVAVLTQAPASAPVEAVEDIADAEVVEVEPEPEPPARTAPEPDGDPITVGELVDAAKTGGRIPAAASDGPARKALLTLCRELTGASFGVADDIVADQQVAEELLAKLGGGQ